MALIKCPECGRDISDKSPACIHCGYPLDLMNKSSSTNQTNKTEELKTTETSTVGNNRLYSLELIDYGDKKIQVAVALKNALNIGDAEALTLVASAPCYLFKDKSDHVISPLIKKLDSLPIEYKLYLDGKLKTHKLKSDITKLNPNESAQSVRTSANSNSKKINCPKCMTSILESSRVCPNCGFDGISSYLLQLEREKRPKIVNSSTNYNTNTNYNANNNIPKCPTCQSTNIKKISGLSKASSVAMWGIFSRKVHKQWHCNNCGSEW